MPTAAALNLLSASTWFYLRYLDQSGPQLRVRLLGDAAQGNEIEHLLLGYIN